ILQSGCFRTCSPKDCSLQRTRSGLCFVAALRLNLVLGPALRGHLRRSNRFGLKIASRQEIKERARPGFFGYFERPFRLMRTLEQTSISAEHILIVFGEASFHGVHGHGMLADALNHVE